MNVSYPKVIASLLLSFCGYSFCNAQSSPEFLNCTDSIITLCVQDEGLRLPDNNQVYLGEGNPDATSCSVHVTQKKRVRSTCGDTLQYEVLLFLNDTSPAYILKSLTNITTDSVGEAELSFGTEESPELIISQAGIPYNQKCNDYYRIQWIVRDSCGVENICETRLRFYDCSPPNSTEENIVFTQVISSGCILTMFAKDFDPGSRDDCTLFDDMLFSFVESSYSPSYSIGPCAPAYDVEVPWKIWIADQGVDYNCNGFISWNERRKYEYDFRIIFIETNGACCELNDPIITGKVITPESETGIKDVAVTLFQQGQVYPTYITTSDGLYSFQVVYPGDPKTIRPERNDNHKNGVTTLDLIRIQKHLLGREKFTNSFQHLAADVNNSKTITSMDLIEIRKLILGVTTQFPNNQSWRFIDKDCVIPDTLPAWNCPETISFADPLNHGNLDFYGVKIGDVNDSAIPDVQGEIQSRSMPTIEVNTDEIKYNAGSLIHVPIRFSMDQVLTGLQFTITTKDLKVVGMESGVLAVTESNYALFQEECTISWFDENTINVSKDDVLFTLQLRAMEPGLLSQSLSINSDITAAELYMDNEEIFLPVLTFKNEEAEDGLEIISCAPNPWKEETNISFYLPQSDQVVFNLFDVAGRKVFAGTQYLKNGYHEFQLNTSCFDERGMMFFEIRTSNDKEVKKMIVLD